MPLKQKSKLKFQWLFTIPGKDPRLPWAFHTPARLSYFQPFIVTMFFLKYMCLYVIMLFLWSGASPSPTLPFTGLTPTYTLHLDLDATSSRKLLTLAKLPLVSAPTLQSWHLPVDFNHLFNCLSPNHSVRSMKAGSVWVYFIIIVWSLFNSYLLDE